MLSSININNENFVTQNNSKSAIFPSSGSIFATVVSSNGSNFLLEAKENALRFNANFSNFSPNVGDTLEFEVSSTGKNIMLKLINAPLVEGGGGGSAKLSSDEIITLFKQSGFTKEISETSVNSEQIIKDKVVNALKKKLSTSENTSVTAVNKLMSKGVPISQIDVVNLQATLQEIQPSITKTSANTQQHIKDTLTAHSLPHTNENINKLQTSLNYFNENNKDETIIQSIKNGPITLGSLYKSGLYDYSQFKNDLPSLNNFDEELKKLYDFNDIPQTKQNLQYGKLLYTYDTEVTKENIQTLHNVKNTATSYILNAAAQSILNNTSITDISLQSTPSQALYESYENTLQTLQNLNESNIQTVLDNDLPVTLYNLQNTNTTYEQTSHDINTIKYKRQLYEIQHKLTYQVAYNLANKNIDINTMPIDKALQQIQQQERDYYAKELNKYDKQHNNVSLQKNLQTQSISKTNDGQVNQMVNLYDAIKNINPFLPSVYVATTKSNVPFTLQALNTHTTAEKQRLGYEAFMTVPNAKYGDSFSKVKGELERVLSDIGLQTTEENVRVASILSRSNIDITYQSLMEAKVVSRKLNYVIDNLSPSIAASLIKGSNNPLDMHIDDLINYIDENNEANKKGISDSIASHILEIQDTLPDEERTKLIAIYRALHQVTKYNQASLGINIKSGNSLTLGHLLDATQYYAKTGVKQNFIDTAIKDDFVISSPNQQNIREILNNNEQLTKTENEYTSFILKEASVKLNPEVLQNASTAMPLPNLLENIKKESLQRANNVVEEIKHHAKNNAVALNFLEKNNEKATLPKVAALVALVNPNNEIKQKLKKIETILEKEKTIPSTPLNYLQSNDEINTQPVQQALEQALNIQESAVSIDLKEIQLLQHVMHVQSKTPIGSYSLPIRLGGKIETLTMHVKNNISNEVSVVISLTTPKFGNIDAFVKSIGNNVEIYITCENNHFEEVSNNSIFAEILQDKGFLLTNVTQNNKIADYIKEDIIALGNNNYNETTNTTRKQIFTIATCFVNYLENI